MNKNSSNGPLKRVGILQTGRLGDLWFVMPLAAHLHAQGMAVDVIYDAQYEDPFKFAPYIHPKPVPLKDWLPLNNRWGYGFNQAVNQLLLYARMKREYEQVIWNQIFPWRWVPATFSDMPYPDRWYRNHPSIDHHRAPTTLEKSNDQTLLLFSASQSLRFGGQSGEFERWYDDTLQTLLAISGYTPVYIAFGKQPDHPKYQTWRGNGTEYQQRIARCGMIFGNSTSGHVLAHLMGKPAVALFPKGLFGMSRVGGDSVCLPAFERLNPEQIQLLKEQIRLNEQPEKK